MKMTDHKIDQKLLQQAIKVLRDLNAKYYADSSKKKPLLEDEKETTLYLQFSLKKIPKFKSIKMIKMNLPHSLVKDNSEVCLITGDLDKKNHKAEIEPDVLHYKDLLKKHGVDNVSEVVTLRQLRTDYKPYEAKQKLLAAYDVFLTDRKIAECLPRVLGRHFYKKRKFPLQITLNSPNLKQQIEKALSTKVFYLTGHGNCCNSEVAYLDMTDKDISENVVEMAKAVGDKLPGSWDNVMGIYLKTSLSKAIPVYMSYEDPNKVHLEEERNDNSYEIDELSTCPDRLVKVYKDGSVRTVRVKRMAETENFETTNGDENSGNEEQKPENIDDCLNLGNTDLNDKSDDLNKKSKKTKKSMGNILNKDDESFVSSTLKGKTDDLNKKPKSTKKSMGNIFKKDDESFVSSKLKGKTDDLNKKLKSTKKSMGNILKKDDESFVSSKLKGKSDDLNKKSKNIRKSMVNILNKDDESFVSSKLKDKQKKRKSIL